MFYVLFWPPFATADVNGGGGEIRTHGSVTATLDFKSSALNRSATPPKFCSIRGSFFKV